MKVETSKNQSPPQPNKKSLISLRTVLPLVALLLAALLPLGIHSGYVLSLLILAISYAVVVIGLNILIGYTGQLSLGQAALFGIGSYTMSIVTVKGGMPFWIGLIAGVLVPVIFGFAIGLTTSKLSGHYLAMVTICFQMITNLIISNWKLTNGPDGISDIPRPSVFGHTLVSDKEYYLFGLVILAIVVWFAFRLKTSRLGRALAAVRENEMAASVTGVRTYKAKVMAFVLASGLAGLGGVIYASGANYISPSTFNFEKSVVFLTMTIVGGGNFVYGGILGAFLLTFLPEWLRFLKDIYLAVYGLMVVLFIVFLPHGIWSLTSVFKKFFKIGAKADSSDIADSSEIADIKDLLPKTNFESEVIKINNLSKHFGGLKAVDEMNFAVKPREIKALIGPNGSGKTTVLNLLTGLYTPTNGSIIFAGEEIVGQRPESISEKGVARTFQNIRLFGELTVLENVMVGQTSRTKQGLLSVLIPNPKATAVENQIRSKAKAALKFVGLTDKSDWLAKNLPYGQQRLVEIARALATQPKLLLLDEPAAGLNNSETVDLVKLLKKINSLGLPMLLVEHDMSMVKNLANTVTVLNFGQKIAEGDVAVTLQEQVVVEAYLGKEEDLDA